MFAAVDLGSNSFRFHIGKLEGGVIRVVKSVRDPIRLGAGLDKNSNLTEVAMQSAIASLARFRVVMSEYPLTSVRVVATNTLRIAKNAQKFLPLAEAAIGYPIEIISGEEEGRLIYIGVANSLVLPDSDRLVIDIGGGSTEVILGRGAEIKRVESFGIGTVNQSMAFFPDGRIDADSFERAVLSARSNVEDAVEIFGAQHWKHAYGSSGTVRAIADAIAKNGLGDGRITLRSVEALKQRLIEFGHVSRVEFNGLKSDRAAVIMGGLAVLIGLMQELKIELVQPVEAGLRMGVMWDLQLRATQRDRRDQSVSDFLSRLQVDATRAAKVADMAATLFQLLKPASATYAPYLNWSALLHETGMAVSQSAYHKHSAYLISHADLPGFTTREQRVMSTMILGQKGNLRKIGESLADTDFAKAVLALRLAVMFLHAHITLDAGQLSLKMKSRIDVEYSRDWGIAHSTASYWLQKEQEWWNGVGVEFAIRIR
ncbi:Ppx/GppA phosphatase family protein [Herbaspirillum sp. RTI4]|uniref:Ppx/GppA phosphatase family protein n=1 Tax=Herbaspirillum sp. RTI4 TaxID=3048640 RepID=UPI002AB57DA5|nr:Ppx/GppA phosphatase family protein [Herbaspirillum sp. RTI4]MDY7579220.1 Ppx/GppA phosphatase family protein [Herbaspirillum sp. RTI4]MEA9982647.1 Ppx/GppA phosphatase family protein [Herbaspirillum sp. RTI4]